MWFSHAKRLHNGDQVGVRKSASGETSTVYANVLNVYVDPANPALLRFDVLTERGMYLTNLSHKSLV